MLSFNFDFFIRMLIALFTFFDFFIGQRKVIVFYSIDKSLPCGLSVLYKFGSTSDMFSLCCCGKNNEER